MLFLEVAAQAVRGFSPSVRVALRPGYVSLSSPGVDVAPLGELLVALCYPDGRGSDVSFLAPGADAGRAGLSLQGDDHEVWRVVRDLGGAGALHRLNRDTGQYEVVTSDSTEMVEVLRSRLGLPPRRSYEQLFTLTAGQLPSRRPPTPVEPPKTSPARGGLQPSEHHLGAGGDVAARVAQLEAELETAKQAADLQFHHDGLQRDLFRVEERQRARDDLLSRLEEARRALNEAPSPERLGLPDDIVERVRRYPDEKRRHDEALARLFDEREVALSGVSERVSPLVRDNRFTGSVALALVLLVGAGFLSGGLRWLALAAIPFFTFAALLALRWIEALQHQSSGAAKAEVFVGREKKLRDEFSLSNSVVQAALDKTGALGPDDFFAAMGRRKTLEPQVAQLELEFADMETDPDMARVPEEVTRLREALAQAQAQLETFSGGYVREVAEIERDLSRLREPLAPPPVEGFSAVTEEPRERLEDPLPALLSLGADLFGVDVPTLWGSLQQRATQYLSALTERRYHGLEVDASGRGTVQAPGRSLASGELAPADLDALYLSVRLTLIEKHCARARWPAVIEDGLGDVIQPAQRPLFGRMLRHLGTLTQVLHVTGADGAGEGAVGL